MLPQSGRIVVRRSIGTVLYNANRTSTTSTSHCTRHSHSSSPRTKVPKSSQSQKFLFVIAGASIALGIAAATHGRIHTAYAEAPKKKDLARKDAVYGKTDMKHASTSSLVDSPEIFYNNDPSNIKGALAELTSLLSSARVSTELGPRISHSSTEWSEAPHGDEDKYALVVCPQTTEEVSQIAKICHKRRIPMVAFSGGTSLEGTLASTQGGVCIDFKLMNKVIEVRKDDLDATVQPAVGYEELNSKLEASELFFPPDPGPGAQIGGMIAQGCSGTNAFRYGTMKDWVLGLTLVLADGTIVKTRGRPRKSSAGYDLTRLIVGSEGTLGFVTEANIKLTSLPVNSRVAVAAFPNTQKAVEVAMKVAQSDMPVAAMELMCDVSMRAVNESGYCDKEYPETPTLFMKFAGKDKDAVDNQIKMVEMFAKESSCKTFEFSRTDDEAEAIWAARKTILWSILTLKNDPSDAFLSADTAVPISKLGVAVDAAKKKIKDSGLTGVCLGHVGDGNFHTAILYPAEQKQKARELITWVQRQAIEFGGTVTGEHGIGLEYRDMLVEELGDNGVDLMRQIKLAMDPLCLLNPDKVFRLNIESKQN